MRADEWQQIKLVFEAALEMPPESRPSYLVSACADPQHRQVVNELLKNHAAAGRFLESQSGRGRYHVFSGEELVASRFRILRQLGYGGMGEVYETFDERLQVRVALKTLRPEFTSDPLALSRFRREILVAREVSHDSVCKIFDLVEHQEADGIVVPCLTMQLIEGQSLQSFLQTRRPLRPVEALPLIRQIAGAIDALHAHGIVHRDLKPSNIMLATHNGAMRAVVTDFGLARPSTHADGGIFESKLDFQAGAPYFMAPELLRDGRPGPASDIYAMGLIVDEMVTETRAFPAESLHSLYYQKLWVAPIPPIARSTGLSPQWNRVILRCLATEIGDRYTCAGDVVSDLELTETVPVVPPPPTPSQAEEQQLSAIALRRAPWQLPFLGWRVRTSMIVLALMAAAIVIITGTLARQGKSSVVVFPIENLTDVAGANLADVSYLCKGIRAELMRRLTLIEGVQVIPYYEPRSKTRIDQLKGRFSLEGLLQASGNRVRLTAQLTDNRDGTLLWSQNFERDLQNPLQLQLDIAEGSVQALQLGTLFGRPVGIRRAGITLPGPLLTLFGFQRAHMPRAPTASSTAFDYYLRGQYLFEERTVPAALDALRSYENALREDPNFALAEGAMADVEFVLMDYEYEPQATLVARAKRYAGNAIRLDPELAEAYTSLGAVGQAERDFAEAEASYKRALQLSPRFSRAHRWYSGLLMQFGRRDESLEEMRQAVELDPYDYSAESNQGLFLYYARRYAGAAAKLEDTLAHKDLLSARIHLGRVYCQMALHSSGNEARAAFGRALQQADAVEAAMRRSMAQSPSVSSPRSINYSDRMHAEYYTLSGHPKAARPYLERLASDTAAGRISPISLGTFYAAVGDADRALPLLKDAAVRKDRQLLFIKVMPEFDPIRRDERFQSLLKFMGF
jgi:serine/threonine protein kinase/TolB-like protein/Tfp pilus assembly protein PilF